MLKTTFASGILLASLSFPLFASESENEFVIEKTYQSADCSYSYSGYTSEEYLQKVIRSKGNFEKHPSYVSGDALNTFRWVKNELVGKNDRIYTIRTSTLSKPSQKILTLSFSGLTGDFKIKGVRVKVNQATTSFLDGKLKNVDHTFTYEIYNAYGLTTEQEELYTLCLEGIIYNNLTEFIDALHDLEFIDKLNAAGTEKYQEYINFMKKQAQLIKFLQSQKRQQISELLDIQSQLRVTSRINPDKHYLLVNKISWIQRPGQSELISPLMLQEDAQEYLDTLNRHLGLETSIGKVYPSRSGSGHRVVFKGSEFTKIPNELI